MKFSVIIPTYNRADFISKTLKSVLEQEYSDFEIIVVDDGSTDNTEYVVKSLECSKLHYYKTKNQERGAARNFGLSKSKGEYINFFDSDDIMYPNHLKEANKQLEKYHKPEVLCFPFDYLDSQLELTGTKKGFRELMSPLALSKNHIHLNGAFIKKSILKKSVQFIENREFRVSEDWYFFFKLALSFDIVGVPTPTSGYVIHSESTMSNFSSTDYLVAWKYFCSLLDKHKTDKRINHRKIKYEFLSMTALAFALENSKKLAIQHALKALWTQPISFFCKRNFATIKNILNAT